MYRAIEYQFTRFSGGSHDPRSTMSKTHNPLLSRRHHILEGATPFVDIAPGQAMHTHPLVGDRDASHVRRLTVIVDGDGVVQGMARKIWVVVEVETFEDHERVFGDLARQVAEIVRLLALAPRIVLARFPEQRPTMLAHQAGNQPDRVTGPFSARAPSAFVAIAHPRRTIDEVELGTSGAIAAQVRHHLEIAGHSLHPVVSDLAVVRAKPARSARMRKAPRDRNRVADLRLAPISPDDHCDPVLLEVPSKRSQLLLVLVWVVFQRQAVETQFPHPRDKAAQGRARLGIERVIPGENSVGTGGGRDALELDVAPFHGLRVSQENGRPAAAALDNPPFECHIGCHTFFPATVRRTGLPTDGRRR